MKKKDFHTFLHSFDIHFTHYFFTISNSNAIIFELYLQMKTNHAVDTCIKRVIA